MDKASSGSARKSTYIDIWPETTRDEKGKKIPKGELCEVSRPIIDAGPGDEDLQICLQKCTYHYAGGITERGFRFIRRRKNGTLQASRGQACIPSIKMLGQLLKDAEKAGWWTDNDMTPRYGRDKE